MINRNFYFLRKPKNLLIFSLLVNGILISLLFVSFNLFWNKYQLLSRQKKQIEKETAVLNEQIKTIQSFPDLDSKLRDGLAVLPTEDISLYALSQVKSSSPGISGVKIGKTGSTDGTGSISFSFLLAGNKDEVSKTINYLRFLRPIKDITSIKLTGVSGDLWRTEVGVNYFWFDKTLTKNDLSRPVVKIDTQLVDLLQEYQEDVNTGSNLPSPSLPVERSNPF